MTRIPASGLACCLLFALATPPLEAQSSRPSRVEAFEDGRFEVDDSDRAIDGQRLEAPLPTRSIRLAILPDRTTGRDWGLPYLVAAIEDLARQRPDAVFTVGDMVQGYTRDEARYEREVDAYLHAIRPIADRFYPTAGNHDVISGTRDPGDLRFVERYRRRFGPLHYTVEIGGVTVIVLFSDEAMTSGRLTFSDAQLEWLRGELEAVEGGPIVLLMHRPLWRYQEVGWMERVQPLLAEHGVDAVLAGHFHAMQKDETRDGVEYHILGTCGGMIDQHPLTGQLQHVTLLQFEPEAERGRRFSLHHQIAGTTLPDDFVIRADQDRVWALKRRPEVAVLRGSVPDPAHGPFEVPLEIELHNPLDVAVSFIIEPSSGPGEWVVDDDATWRSLTSRDIHNPQTMHGRGRSLIQVSETALLEPGETRVLDAAVVSRSPKGGRPGRPPQLDVTARFQDEAGRSVPVVIRRRLAIDRRPLQLAAGGEPVALPVCAWTFSPYDTLESDPNCLLGLDDAGRLLVDVTVPGDLLVDDGPDVRPVSDRLNTPMADAIRLEVDPGAGAPHLVVYWEPAEGAPVLIDADGTTVELETRHVTRDDQGWRGAFTLPVELPTGTRIRLGVADNDLTYHTQWRHLTPPDHWLEIRREPDRAAD